MRQSGWPGTGGVPAAEYDYPRRLTPAEIAGAAAVGVGVGLAAFYVARVLGARTPLNEPAPAFPLPDAVVSRAAEMAARANPDAPLRPRRRG